MFANPYKNMSLSLTIVSCVLATTQKQRWKFMAVSENTAINADNLLSGGGKKIAVVFNF